MMRVLKNWVVTVIKFIIVVALLAWMVITGKLSFAQMSLIFDRPDALLASFAVWFFGPVILGSLRWWMLIRGANLIARILGR